MLTRTEVYLPRTTFLHVSKEVILEPAISLGCLRNISRFCLLLCSMSMINWSFDLLWNSPLYKNMILNAHAIQISHAYSLVNISPGEDHSNKIFLFLKQLIFPKFWYQYQLFCCYRQRWTSKANHTSPIILMCSHARTPYLSTLDALCQLP